MTNNVQKLLKINLDSNEENAFYRMNRKGETLFKIDPNSEEESV